MEIFYWRYLIGDGRESIAQLLFSLGYLPCCQLELSRTKVTRCALFCGQVNISTEMVDLLNERDELFALFSLAESAKCQRRQFPPGLLVGDPGSEWKKTFQKQEGFQPAYSTLYHTCKKGLLLRRRLSGQKKLRKIWPKNGLKSQKFGLKIA